MRRKANSTIYRQAAEALVERARCCCVEIDKAAGALDQYDWSAQVISFSEIFRPRNAYSGAYWFGNTLSEKNQLARSLALLFMEQIAKDSK